MKQIYIILAHTGTVLSRIIRWYTKAEFSHVSIALDKELQEMYSFGRLNPYNPFIGGFVHEYIDQGTFKRFKNTMAKVYQLQIEDEQYEKIKKTISEFEQNKEKYKFNIIGLFAAGFNIRIYRNKYLYCAEFAKYVLELAELKTELPEVVKPENFKKIKGLKEIYSGKMKNYNTSELSI